MSRNLHVLDKLSEFPPLSPEEDDSGVNFILNFFKFGKERNADSRETPESREVTPVSESTPSKLEEKATTTASSVQVEAKDANASPSSASASLSSGSSLSLLYEDIGVGRSLPNVLKRISNLVALKNTGLQSYKDSDFKRYWMPDSVSKECYECGEKFTAFRRRHHCRVCGQIFCSRCCKEEIPGKILGCTGALRVCTYCGKVVLSYLQSADISADLSADLGTLQEDLQHKFGESVSQTINVPQSSLSPAEKRLRRKHSYQEDRFVLGRASVSTSGQFLTSEDLREEPFHNSNLLYSILSELKGSDSGLPLQTVRLKQKTCQNCFRGTQLVDWLLSHNKASSMVEAVNIGQALLEGNYIECVSQPNDVTFHDGNALYQLSSDSQKQQTEHHDLERSISHTDSDTLSIPSSSSTYYLDLDVSENKVQLRRPTVKKDERKFETADANSTCISKEFLKDTLMVESSESREMVPSMGWHKVQHLRTDNGEKEAYHLLSKAFENHEDALLHQLLNSEGLSEDWALTVQPLVHQIVDLVRPDVKNEADFMDIRQYVQFKKVPGGSRSECRMISGTVFTKHVSHRGMSTQLTNPKILLLFCSIAYERVEGKYLSLEPLILQERDYLKNVVARIVSLEPDVVLVENTVSRLAQEMLLEHHITLVLNVKTVVLERLARLTQADMVRSIDATVSKSSLGMCHTFAVRQFNLEKGQRKFLMFFEGCATHLGCTALLRGGSSSELKRLKKVMQHLILVNYSWRREMSFLMDEFAMPPPAESSPVPQRKTSDDSKECSLEPKEQENHDNTFVDPLQAALESPEGPTDPLQQYLKAATSFDEDLQQMSIISECCHAENSKFKEALDKTVLSSSPLVTFRVPYLETEEGSKSRLRRFFPEHVFWSAVLFPQNLDDSSRTEADSPTTIPCYVRDPHPFVCAKLTQPIENVDVQAMLANFRAVGRRLRHPNEPLPASQEIKQEAESGEASKLKTPVDSLSPYNHQKLAVLFCSFSSDSGNAPAFCVNPWIVHMELYGKHDIPLGQFLDEYCFRRSYNCPSETCATPMLRHIRRFVHDGSCIQVTLKQLDSQIPVEGNAILMWSWCAVCKQVSPVVPMSVDTWSLSLAKYLELRFHSPVYTRRGKENTCKHSIHQQHYQYFGYKDVIATFKFIKVQMWQISLPPTVIQIPYKASEEIQSAANEEVKQLALKGYEVFSSVVEKLCDIGIEADPAKKEVLTRLKSQLNKDNSSFKTKIEDIQIKLTSPKLDGGRSESYVRDRLWDIEDSLLQLKRMIADAVFVWNSRIAEVAKKKDEKSKKGTSEVTVEGDPVMREAATPSPLLNQSAGSDVCEEQSSPSDNQLQISNTDALRAESTPFPEYQHSGPEDLWASSVENIKKISSLDVPDVEIFDNQSKGHERSHSEGESKFPTNSVSLVDGASKLEKKSIIQNQTSVKQIISQLMTSTTNVYTIQSPLGVCEHHLLPQPAGPMVLVNTNEPSSIVAYALSSSEYQRKLAEYRLLTNSDVPIASELVASGDSVNSTKRTVLSFLRGSSSPNLNANRTGSRNSDAEPVQQHLNASEEPEQESRGANRSSSVLSTVTPESTIDVHFNDYSTSFHCRIFFADQFSQLREIVCPDGEESFIRSLAGCVQWAARGGKSGSTFCKTKDDRFVLKEMSQNEAQLFLEVAPNYLNYIRSCLESGQPTLLGKIVGAFRISYRGISSSTSNKTHLLVMENLFYGRTITQRFDLKGSQRNRLVETSGPNAQGEEIVLLDENLIKMSCEAPLYILPHCKMVLTLAIERDTQFLSSQAVMDYSLLVGLDEQSKELVLGIIDYVRLFTWDKKLETMVKSSGILGGHGKMPTIVSPEVYRARFVAAMHRYFLPVPDRWTGLSSGVLEN
ncbi:1-phosphatidylinositol 3-phosphate 5-kinase isoform X2 [Neocloeon triangulifer]|uniref:1-phosphatidylinositol 3-phosphate 5-kinase isoform X2 n=1 Tax=Neocloeon triangulifer TaxID=2078957 RepID=UPI00286F8310|nr:1-phosphatidylinositol 3-phosphate 5-kinase isoform X2 [Neocloeon triangulifer]